ncbi:beta-1,2-xylosyltransferase isoform X2 [Ziziphus jujuba]|uniref:Beta-1,2-xylosyltransferase isoform X2 n=2 Tax=Ziziphus jujuba TaxID=326968 RepID=A0A6P3YT27_ZIZJJ|nr:beta-1,2-xylosyltransferase isoform X2 [Ziziphus jujuba]
MWSCTTNSCQAAIGLSPRLKIKRKTQFTSSPVPYLEREKEKQKTRLLQRDQRGWERESSMMIRRNLWLVKILVFLFALNSLSFYFYFSSNSKPFTSHQSHYQNPQSVTVNRLPLTENHRFQNHPRYSKPWPILPSYLPWSQTPDVPFRSCEAYFGNGFTRRVDLLRPEKTHAGWFRCWFSETLRSSVCEGGSVRMAPERIRMSAGGESLEEVIGRKEEEELPVFEDGAFEIDGGAGSDGETSRLATQDFLNEYVPEGEVSRHTMRQLIGSVRVVPADKFECHEAPLEETWNALFSSLRYAKNFTGPVCFRHAILSPLGYETAMFKGLTEEINCNGASAQDLWQNPDDHRTARLSEFGEMVRAAFGLPVHKHRAEKPVSGHNVLFVRREDYLAHPRHGGKVESRLSNEEEVFNFLKSWASNHKDCKINLVNGLFAHMSMKEQVRAIQDASVIIGAHGAGLTHIVSAMPKTVILEIISSQYRRPHFALIAHWKGLEYHAINLDGSYANPPTVVDKLRMIMRSLRC